MSNVAIVVKIPKLITYANEPRPIRQDIWFSQKPNTKRYQVRFLSGWLERKKVHGKGLLAPTPCFLYFLGWFVCLFCLFTIYPIYDFAQGFTGSLSVSWCGLSILISAQYEHVYSLFFLFLFIIFEIISEMVIVDLSFIAGQLKVQSERERELNFYQHLKRAI